MDVLSCLPVSPLRPIFFFQSSLCRNLFHLFFFWTFGWALRGFRCRYQAGHLTLRSGRVQSGGSVADAWMVLRSVARRISPFFAEQLNYRSGCCCSWVSSSLNLLPLICVFLAAST
uniref:(northern house mosquito) hypothetical protein n=1 Tax=Culex pipiens TaxID=7175 RepID=A0A8D8N978_CULPI